jgi:2-succinyl-5-enolpyruvyl-6-hydroxy-3-cyclohexene-1-carboxylate synthase
VTNGLNKFLINEGVKKVFFCSGSRNSSLLKELDTFEIEYHFDERAAAFQALGTTQITDEPVVVCVTSGSALAESLPALIEAYYSYKKIIIISADRPKRLHGTYAPQTINQKDIYKDFTRSSFSGELSSFALKSIVYPIHLNIEIDDAKINIPLRTKGEIQVADLESLLLGLKNVFMIITDGHRLVDSDVDIIERLPFPVFLECTTNLKLKRSTLRFDQTLLDYFESEKVDLVIKLGSTPISKIWRLLDNKYIDTQVLSINDSNIGLGRGLYVNEEKVIKVLESLLMVSKTSVLDNELKLRDCMDLYPKSEIVTIKGILHNIENDSVLYCGNSMPIRYVQMLAKQKHFIMASRGANGIDGQVSTAIGIANSTNQSVHCIIGDLTFLYDVGSVIMKLPSNLTIHVINNYGGRIFERVNSPLPIINEHNLSISNLFKNKITNLIEYSPDNEQTKAFWKCWSQS